jgi:prophage antirepressor-like protein
MEILTFQEDGISLHLRNEGTWETPLFRASDVGKLLGIVNIHNAIQNYDSKKKINKQAMTPGGLQNVTFLTPHGLYHVTMKSSKPFATKFQAWVFDVVEELRTKGKYEVEEKYKQLLEQRDGIIKTKEQRLLELEHENSQLAKSNNVPVIYIFNKDTREEVPELKIGISEKVRDRIKPYKQTHPYGRLEYTVEIPEMNLRTAENWLHALLADYRVGTKEVFKMSVNDAKMWCAFVRDSIHISSIKDLSDKKQKVTSILNHTRDILDGIQVKVCTNTIACQTDDITMVQDNNIDTDNNIDRINKFIDECCIVRENAQVSSSNIQGAYRLWARKAEKASFLALNDYLKTKFKPCRMKVQNTDHVENGFEGLCLKQAEHNIVLSPSPCDVELFIYQTCKLVPGSNVLTSSLAKEYMQWKKRLDKVIKHDKDEIVDINAYLKDKPYALKAVIWNIHGNGVGYYGLQLKSDEMYKCTTSSTAKKVQKRDANGNILDSWSTIAKAAQSEGMCAAKMSRLIKHHIEYNGCYFETI